jgi:hypothetical protein
LIQAFRQKRETVFPACFFGEATIKKPEKNYGTYGITENTDFKFRSISVVPCIPQFFIDISERTKAVADISEMTELPIEEIKRL